MELEKRVIILIPAYNPEKKLVEIVKKLQESESKIVLGTRNFKEKQVPIINKVGNIFISYVFLQKNKGEN